MLLGLVAMLSKRCACTPVLQLAFTKIGLHVDREKRAQLSNFGVCLSIFYQENEEEEEGGGS